MKSKDWKNFWLYYLVFASGSTIYCSTNMEVVKATNPKKHKKQEVFVSTISSLRDSRLISQFSSNDNLTKADLKKKTKKNRTLILQPEISGDRDESDLQFTQKKWRWGGTPRNFLEEKISWEPCGGLFKTNFVLKPVQNTIVSQIKQDTSPLEREHKTNCDNLIPFPKTLENKTRRIQSPQISLLQVEIAQNQESSTPSPVSEPKDSPQDTPALPSVSENIEEDTPALPSVSETIEQDPPPLESQPTDFGTPSSEEIEQKLDSLEDERSKKLERLLQLLKKNQEQQQQSLNQELGVIRVVEVPLEEKVPQPTEQKVPPSIEKPVAQFKPVGYLLGRVGYFNSSNIFSSRSNAINDGLIFSGLTLAAAPFKIGPKTYLNGSIDGNIIRYGKKSEFDYNQIRFNLGIYQQLSKRMYSEIGWNNQQLFYSRNSSRFNLASGDKFLNENSFRFSVGRRDPLAPKLNLGSFYEFRLSLTNPPEKRNRIINYVWLSLNYSLQESLRIGVDYQFNLSNFLERSREDQYHRLSGSLKYRISELSSINLQSGFTLGGSTDRNIDFDGWFFSINYSWDLGQF